MKLLPTGIEGCVQVHPTVLRDDRGVFVKTFNVDTFAQLGLSTSWREEYYSRSRMGVIRGMHFQTPPYDHEKLVFCIRGRVVDVVLDLRRSSSSFGKHVAVTLDEGLGNGLYIPKGMAHGFLAQSEDAILAYKVTTVHVPANDKGIHWNSFGFDWGISEPLVSDRDRSHPLFASYTSPF